MSSNLDAFSQLPMNAGIGSGYDTSQNSAPTGPILAPAQTFVNPFAGPAQAPIPPTAFYTQPSGSTSDAPPNLSYLSDPTSQPVPNSFVAPGPPPEPSQPQYLTDLTRMFGALTDNQIAFQQGIMQILGQHGPDRDAPQSRLGSSVKVRNPRMFTGKHEEVTPFLSEVNRIIQFNAISFPTDNHKVIFLALYLKDGIPVEWFNHLEAHASPLLHNWPRFLTEFRTKFADPRLIQTAEYKLDRLVQTDSAHSYLTHFIEISSHLDMTEQTTISRFMKGLKPAIKDNLVSIINRPQTLHGWENIIIQVDANIHQREIEKQEGTGKKPAKPPLEPSPIPTTTITDIVPMEVDAVRTSSAPRGKLTQAERDYRFKNNLCLYCGKPGHQVSECSACKARHGNTPQQGKVKPEEK